MERNRATVGGGGVSRTLSLASSETKHCCRMVLTPQRFKSIVQKCIAEILHEQLLDKKVQTQKDFFTARDISTNHA